MRPTTRHRRMALACLFLVAPLVTLGTAEAHHTLDDHPLMRIEVAADGAGITYTYNGTFIVTDGNTGPHILIPMPDDAILTAFRPTAAGTTGTTAVDGDHATFHYTADPPSIGTRVNATFTAHSTIEPDANVRIRWPVPEGDLPFAEVRTPDGYGISQNAGLRYDFHGLTVGPDTNRWSRSALEVEVLEVVLRPYPRGVDAAHADPPLPGLGWLVVIAVAGIAGAAWYLGKRFDSGKGQGP